MPELSQDFQEEEQHLEAPAVLLWPETEIQVSLLRQYVLDAEQHLSSHSQDAQEARGLRRGRCEMYREETLSASWKLLRSRI